MSIAVPILLGLWAACSSCLNGIVIYVFGRMGFDKLTFKDAFMLSMSIGDLIQSLFGYSLEIFSIIDRDTKKTTQGMFFCKASGFIITFLALSSTAHLTILALDRYFAICQPFIASRFHDSYILCVLLNISCWAYALAWSSFPLFGWSGYELEDDSLRCSIDWAAEELHDKMYIIFLFVFCFLLPLALMFLSFISIRKELQKMQSRAANHFGRDSKAARDNIRAEKRHTKLAVVMSVVFIVTWTPYALLSFWASFFKHVGKLPSVFATASAIIAKSSTMFNPIIYSIMHKKFRQSIRATPLGKFVFCTARISPEETSCQEPTRNTVKETAIDNKSN